MIPVTLLMYNAERILLALGQDKEVSLFAGRLLFYQIPGIWMQSFDEAFQLFFLALGKNDMMMLIDLCRIPLHCLLAYILIVRMQLELFGCAMTVNLVYFLKFIVTKLVLDYYKKTDVALRESMYIKIDRGTFKGFRSFINLASAGLLLSCLEWWINELMALLGGYISVNAQAASVIVNTIQMLMSYITLSFSCTISAMIGSALGDGNVKQAKTIAMQASVNCYCYVVTVVIFCLTFNDSIVSCFIHDEEVRDLASDSLKACSIVFLLDSM